MDYWETPLMEFYPGGDGDLQIRYPLERTIAGDEAFVWLARSDAQKVLSFIRSRQKATKDALLFTPPMATISSCQKAKAEPAEQCDHVLCMQRRARK